MPPVPWELMLGSPGTNKLESKLLIDDQSLIDSSGLKCSL